MLLTCSMLLRGPTCYIVGGACRAPPWQSVAATPGRVQLHGNIRRQQQQQLNGCAVRGQADGRTKDGWLCSKEHLGHGAAAAGGGFAGSSSTGVHAPRSLLVEFACCVLAGWQVYAGGGVACHCGWYSPVCVTPHFGGPAGGGKAVCIGLLLHSNVAAPVPEACICAPERVGDARQQPTAATTATAAALLSSSICWVAVTAAATAAASKDVAAAAAAAAGAASSSNSHSRYRCQHMW